MSGYSHTSKVDIGGSEVEFEFDYEYSPGRAASPASFASAGRPPEGSEITITTATILIPGSGRHHAERHKAPDWLLRLFNADDYILDDLRKGAE